MLGIATGKSRRGIDRLFEREGWASRFLTVQTADDHPSKPHPAMIRAAMAETGVGPERTVMVGDTTFDVEMALAAGVGALGVAWGYHPPEELREAGAHGIIESCDRLLGRDRRLLRAPGAGGVTAERRQAGRGRSRSPARSR